MTSAHRPRPRTATAVAGTLAVGLLWAVAGPAGAAGAPAVPAPTSGWVRFAHLAPAGGLVTVDLDGKPISINTGYRSVSAYQSVPDGVHTITLVPTGGTGPTLTGKITMSSGAAMTAAALQGPTGLELRTYPDDLSAAAAGHARIRLLETVPGLVSVSANLSPDPITSAAPAAATSGVMTPAPATVAATTPAESVQISSVAFGAASPYVSVSAGSYGVAITNPTGGPVVTGTNWPVAAGTVATIAVVQATTGATLEVLRDAAGAAAMPTGGVQTGFGGTAPRPGHSGTGTAAGFGVAALAGTALVVGRRRRTATRRVSAPIA